MTQVFKNRAFVYTATTGTGTITLGSAVLGYQTFGDAGVADTNTVRYLILDDNDAWEIGTGTYTASGTTLARSVEESSNSDALLDLSGNASVAVIIDAADITSLLSNLFENPLFLRERSAASADQAAYGQLWVKNSTPNELWFTDDAGNDHRISELPAASFSEGDILYHDGTGLQRLAKGSAGQFLKQNSGETAPEYDGAFTWAYSATYNPLVLLIDLLNVPSWVTTIRFAYSDIRFDASNSPTLQLGTASGLETTGYASHTSTIDGTVTGTASITTAILCGYGDTNGQSGHIDLTLIDGNTWAWSGTDARDATSANSMSAGYKTLADTLTRIRISGNGGGGFTSGALRIGWM